VTDTNVSCLNQSDSFSSYIWTLDPVAVYKGLVSLSRKALDCAYLPMLRHVAQPRDAGVLVGRVRLAGADVDLAGDGLVDEGLTVFFEQLDQLLLGAGVAPNPPRENQYRFVRQPHPG